MEQAMEKNLDSMTNIVISEDSKEESVKKYQKMISEFQKDQHDDRIIIYTNRSKSETNQIGAGLVYTTNFSCYQWKAWNLGSKCEVFDAELFAIIIIIIILPIEKHMQSKTMMLYPPCY